jgi:hypothetical protein
VRAPCDTPVGFHLDDGPLHREPLLRAGVRDRLSERAGHRPLGGCKDRRPARLLLLQPAPHTFTMGWLSRGGDVSRQATPLLAQCKHASALPLARPVEPGVPLCASGLTARRCARRQFLRVRRDRGAEAGAAARPRAARAQALGGAVEPIGQNPPAPISRLLVDRRALVPPPRRRRPYCAGRVRHPPGPQGAWWVSCKPRDSTQAKTPASNAFPSPSR